jgi:hypothetical protein
VARRSSERICRAPPVGFLDHVGGIDAALEAAVHAQAHHAFKAVPMAFDQDSQGALVAITGGVPQFLVATGIGTHDGVPISVHENASRTFTALERILFWPPRTSKILPGSPGIKEPRRSVRGPGLRRRPDPKGIDPGYPP